MSPSVTGDAASRERAEIAALLAIAGDIRHAAIERGHHPPRFILEAARTMARHLGMSPRRFEELVPPMAFWQAYVASALARHTAAFTEAHSRFPASYKTVQSAVAEMADHPQLVFVIFHMAAMPLVAALIAHAVAAVHGRPGHVLLSPQNAARLQAESGRWVLDVSHVITTDGPGLRHLMSGLREGTITRLLILPDGPRRATDPRTRTLSGVTPSVAFRTGLLSRILAMGIPMRPLTHFWTSDALELHWHPLLGEAAISSVAALIEGLLTRHPEQWLNWPAASLRA